MAFKTDTIKLKLLSNDNQADEVDGELAVVNDVLRLRTGGAWSDVSSGGGGGASELQDLSDVPSAPSTEHTVGVVNNANQLQFAKLSVDNIHTDSLNTSTTWDNDDTTLATTAAIQDWVEGQSYLTTETSHADVVVDGDFAAEGIMRRGNAPGVYSIITDNSSNWDTAYNSILTLGSTAGTALEGNTQTISAAQSTKVDFLTVTQAVDLDDVETKTLEAHGWGNHASAGYSTVDDLNDLSDVATPATLDASHNGKAVGVANTAGTASVISFAILDLVGLGPIEFRFSASGTTYRINFTQTGSNPVVNDTNFAANIATLTTDNGATVNSVATNLRTLLTNAFDASGYAISGTGGDAVLTADAVGPDLAIVQDPSNPDITITETTGVAAGYRYELINTSGAPDPNWNHVQNSAWGGDLTIATNTASNLTWINTQNPGANELTIRQPSDYGAYAVITVMNASNSTMDISTVDNSFDFNCQQLTPTQVNTITLSIFQKAILVRTAGTDWEVVLASI